MTLALTQSITAVAASALASFLAVGGIPPYTYSVELGGAGGTIDSSTGAYVAPDVASSNPDFAYDTIQVIDSASSIAVTRILVGSPLLLLCDVIQKGLGLADGRVYLWDQKIMQPTDSGLYVSVSVPSCKPFANVNRWVPDGGESDQFVAVQATVDLDIISRGPDARDRKEEILLALNSDYARQQQDANAFGISRFSTGFVNLSMVDGAAIPYRYRITVKLGYAVSKTSPVPFYDQFEFKVYTDPPETQLVSAFHQISFNTDPVSNTETSITLPAGSLSFELVNVGDVSVAMAFVSGETANPARRKTMFPYAPFGEENLAGVSLTLYFQSAQPSQRIELTYTT